MHVERSGRSFVPLQNYTTLKQICIVHPYIRSFVPLQNYTTLKHQCPFNRFRKSFVPLQNYTTLKHSTFFEHFVPLCIHTKLHYSQTQRIRDVTKDSLYTHTKLHHSQTIVRIPQGVFGFVPIQNYTTLKLLLKILLFS